MKRKGQLDALRELLWRFTDGQRKVLVEEAKRLSVAPQSPEQAPKESSAYRRGA